MATRRTRRTTGIKKHVSPTAVNMKRSRERGPRVGRDGKAKVACPNCGSEYLVPGAALDDELACKHCRTRFVPRSAHRQRAPEKFNATPYAIGGGVLVLIVGIYLATRGGDPPPPPKEEPVKVAIDPSQNPRVVDAKAWAHALGADDTYNLALLSDTPALAARYGITAIGDAAKDAVVAKLLEDPELHWFDEFHIDSAALEDPSQQEATTGRVVLYMTPKQEWAGKKSGKPYFYDAGGRLEIALTYRFEGGHAKFSSWEIVREIGRGEIAKNVHRAHKEIGEATTVKRNFGGQEIEVVEASLVALGHMEGTSPELQREIDAEIAKIVDIEGDPRAANRASMRLVEIGKPAIPRLLNKMYETKMDSHENILRLRRVCAALEGITGQRFGFNPSVIKDPSGASNEEMRLSALKQWYGYWTTHHDREDWDLAIDKEESLEMPVKQPEKNP